MNPRSFLDTQSLPLGEFQELLALADARSRDGARDALRGRILVLLFFNPSLRTRVSFEVAMHRLGGKTIALTGGADTWKMEFRDGVEMLGDAAEHVREAAGVLSEYGDALGVRCFPEMKDLAEDRREPVLGAFARHAHVPVLNLESATRHPCQGLADALTLNQAFGHARGHRVTLTWAYHPRALPMAVPNSFVLTASRLGVELTIAHPEGWELDPSVLEAARANADATGGAVRLTHDRDEGARGAEAVYAKSWGGVAYYGRPDDETRAKAGLRPWIVDEDWLRRSDDAWFLHCLPVRRNVVASDAVLDGPRSLVRKQARNRVYAQEAVLLRALASA